MRRRERVIDIEIAELRELRGEVRVVLLLARVEAQIFQQRDLARLQRGDDPLGLGSDAIGRETHGAAAGSARQRLDKRAQRLRRVRPLRPAEMRHHDRLAAALDNRREGRREPFDAGRVGHLAVPDRDVQIGAHQNAFAGDIEIVEGAEARHRRGSFRIDSTDR